MNTFIILCGGYGTRFQKVSKTLPKILIEIKPGITMIDWLIQEYLPLKSKIILATGHLHEKVFDHVNQKEYRRNIIFAEEKERLGTGGALINASKFVDTKEFIALNGDTIQELSIEKFLKKSKLDNSHLINVGCTLNKKVDSGIVLINQKNYIISFTEKKLPTLKNNNLKKLSSLGIYRCCSNYFKKLPVGFISLEEEIIPELVSTKKVKASIFDTDYKDYGTFDRYNELMQRNIYKG